MDHVIFATVAGLQARIAREEKLWFTPVGAVNEYDWAKAQPIKKDVRLLADPRALLDTLEEFRDRRTDGDPRVRERLRTEGYALIRIYEGLSTTYLVDDKIVLLREREQYITD